MDSFPFTLYFILNLLSLFEDRPLNAAGCAVSMRLAYRIACAPAAVRCAGNDPASLPLWQGLKTFNKNHYVHSLF